MRAFARYKEFEQQFTAIAQSITESPTARLAVADKASEDPQIRVDWPEFGQRQQMCELGLSCSEIVHHIRCTMDYLIYYSAWADSGRRQDDTQFPVCTKAADFEKASRRRMAGISQAHKGWIREVQPFNGVRWAGLLVDMSNTDKHRFVLETSPTLRFRIDRGSPTADPADRSNVTLPVDQVRLDCIFATERGSRGNVFEVLNQTFEGLANLVNRFLSEAGQPPIEIESSADNTATTSA